MSHRKEIGRGRKWRKKAEVTQDLPENEKLRIIKKNHPLFKGLNLQEANQRLEQELHGLKGEDRTKKIQKLFDNSPVIVTPDDLTRDLLPNRSKRRKGLSSW